MTFTYYIYISSKAVNQLSPAKNTREVVGWEIPNTRGQLVESSRANKCLGRPPQVVRSLIITPAARLPARLSVRVCVCVCVCVCVRLSTGPISCARCAASNNLSVLRLASKLICATFINICTVLLYFTCGNIRTPPVWWMYINYYIYIIMKTGNRKEDMLLFLLLCCCCCYY